MHPSDAGPWIGDWASGLPLIVLTVVIHVCGLALIGERVVRKMTGSLEHRRFMPRFVLVMGRTSFEVTILHGIEAGIWAIAFRVLCALPNQRSAMLYSLNAITSYGHANIFLQEQWQLLGGFEALNGMLLFGLTTAFMFAIIQRVWPLGSREAHHQH